MSYLFVDDVVNFEDVVLLFLICLFFLIWCIENFVKKWSMLVVWKKFIILYVFFNGD